MVFGVWKDRKTLQRLQRQSMPELRWQDGVQGADALLLTPGHKPPPTVLRAAAVPDSQSVPARQLVTYGVGGRNTVTLSGVNDEELLLCLQREIVNLRGRRVEQQEICIPTREDPETVLAVSAALLLAGLEPDFLPGFWAI